MLFDRHPRNPRRKPHHRKTPSRKPINPVRPAS
jgi:hypothetical protein